MLESTKAILLKLWNDQDIQVVVLISLALQLFLLFTGNLRRRKIAGMLRFIIWLAYVGADAVAVYAIGLLSKYEEKFKLRSRHSSAGAHTLPFLWAPFLLLHLGGQDTITAFSLEDNNLWLRHLLNLVVQVTLTMYVFWKWFDILDSQLLAIAIPIFVAGIIKYGERTWALYKGSLDSLGSTVEGKHGPLMNESTIADLDVTASAYALNTVLTASGLLVGRTLFQLGARADVELVYAFEKRKEGKLGIVMMELGMMYDLLYSKAMVLRSWTGRILRCIAQTSMVVTFVLFVANRQFRAYNKADVVITYTLFVGALFMEACSVSMVVVSPWTQKGTLLNWLTCSVCSLPNAIMQRKSNQEQQQQRLSSFSIGQFNLADCYMSDKGSMKLLISKVVSALGMERKWRNFWHVQHTEDQNIGDYIVGFISTGKGSQQLEEIGRDLNHVLDLELEHAIFRLHISTDLHLSSGLYDGVNDGHGHPEPNEMAVLAAECRMLSNYLMYLMAVCPSMLPVRNSARDIEHFFAKWVRDNHHNGTMGKAAFLKKYAEEMIHDGTFKMTPFELLSPSVASLRAIKDVWIRLLVYAAGKCRGEVHARHLSNGLELLTFVWLLMVHNDVGDLGIREVNLLQSSDPHVTQARWYAADLSCCHQPSNGPLYAFEFHHHAQQPTQGPARLFLEPWDPAKKNQPSFSSSSKDTEQAAVRASLEMKQPPQQDTSAKTDVASEVDQKQDHHVAVDIEPHQ